MALGAGRFSGPKSKHRIANLVRSPRVRAIVISWTGPALIVAAVLLVLHEFAFAEKTTSQHVDVLGIQMPWNCFLGQSLRAGHIPAWNPYSMGGAPFAADLQSGWMYLPAMFVFTVLPCARAIGWFLVLQPLLGGLGMYWFLRGERVSRIAATVGGLVLALALAGSLLGAFIAFAAVTAWIPLLLAAASRFLQAADWPRRIMWAVLTAAAWGQLVAPHLATGVFLGTAALIFYGVARTGIQVRTGHLSWQVALVMWGLVFLSLPLLNLALLLPRMAYFPRTSISLGYEQLQSLAASLSGLEPRIAPIGPTTEAPWPLKMATWPGMYLGALTLGLVLGGWWSSRLRPVVAALSLYGALCYLAGLKPVVRALAPSVESFALADPYIHSPVRFVYGLLPAIAALSAMGLEAWRESRSSATRAVIVLPGVLIWGALPIAQGVHPARLLLLAVGAVSGAAVLAGAGRRVALLVLVPVLVAAELSASDLLGQGAPGGLQSGLRVRAVFESPLRRPKVDAAEYLSPGPIVQAMRQHDDGRFLSLDRHTLSHRGYLPHQHPDEWALLANQRSMLFGLEDIQGYSSVQLRRYWMFVRAASPRRLDYNAAVFPDPPVAAMDLLQVRWVVGPAGDPPLEGLSPITREGRWELYRVPGAPARASVLTTWRQVRSMDEALREVFDPAFHPSQEAVIEGDPGVQPGPPSTGGGAGHAVYTPLGLQAARVVMDAPAPAVLLIRNMYDVHWHATVDGKPARVLPTDLLLQGVPVPPGRHTVLLTYDDPWVGYGLAGTAVALVLFSALALLLVRRARPNPGHDPAST